MALTLGARIGVYEIAASIGDIADVRIEIEDVPTRPASGFSGPSTVDGVVHPTSSRALSGTLFWAAATVALGVAVIILAGQVLRRPAADLRPLRLSIVPPAGTTFSPRDITGSPPFAVSPDGSRLAFVVSAPGAGRQLWVQQLESGIATPLSGTDDATGPFWAYDSNRLAFFARGKLKKVSLGGAAPEDLWVFNFADGTRRPIVEDAKNQVQARLSPNGRWLAYASDESGEWQIYVRPFPEGQKRPIATGSQPLWRSDGKEPFYVTADDELAAVPILDTQTVKVGVSETLFATRIPEMLAPLRTNYAVRPDGQQFLLNSVTPEAVPAPITIAVNWREKWKQ